MTRPATVIVWSGMEHSHLGDEPLTPDEFCLLLDLAELSIRAHLEGRQFAGLDIERLSDRLRRPGGAFVTLNVGGSLNGCIGNIESPEPIATTVAELAIKAAFEDYRLPKLRNEDLAELEIEISLLSPPSPVPAGTRAELLEQLVPGRHGLILTSGGHRAVFLPSVWAQLPQPSDFIDHLLRKAGLPADRWPSDLHADVFTTVSSARRVTDGRS